ncbi:MAG: FAD/NAD(P)-binding oxidoreductase [Acidimicrobiia bacterium]|nr:FAD/NAD(P)-binding oxidoreductase [Acidimicrobiia bacterium]
MSGTVIVGASLAGLRTAEALRKNGYEERVTLLGMEDHLPYDRPPLSKGILTGTVSESDTFFRTADHFTELGVEVKTGVRATALDTTDRAIHTSDGTLQYDNVVIATGAAARTLPGTDSLSGVHVIRTLEDATAIRSDLSNRPRVVVIGAGFIGAEVASSAREMDLDVTIVEALPNPLARAVGTEVGRLCADLHAEGGTTLLCGNGVAEVTGNSTVEGVTLTNGVTIPADVVIVGIGVTVNTGWLEDSGLDISNGVVCDEYMSAGPTGVFAVGDVAAWHNPLFGVTMRVEHWTNAVEQALIVAYNITNPTEQRPYAGIPYFWSDQYGRRIQFLGRSDADEVVIVDRTRESRKPVALYRKDDALGGALAIDDPMTLMPLRAHIMKEGGWEAALAAVQPDS